MSIFEKFQPIIKRRQELMECGVEAINVVMEDVLSSTEAIINGRKTILAGTNNYLGLTFDIDCIDAACQALKSEGTGTTGSRMANGTFAGHLALEKDLADFFECEHAIVFSTGYVANLGMLAGLTGPGDVILIDADCHASIYDGCRLSGAEVLRFRHNDPVDLEKRLRRLGDRVKNTLVVIEGIYSMLGDKAPLAEIADTKDKFGAYLMVDEAHSLGVLGEHGRGLAEAVDALNKVDFIVGTFSKSLGAIGGFCASNHPELELVRFATRPYIFTASPSPATIASTRKALEVLNNRNDLRKHLWENANKLYDKLVKAGFDLGPDVSPIIATRLETKEKALALWSGLLEKGVYVNMVLPPATPDGKALLRCSLSAAHTTEQVEEIGSAFVSLRVSIGKTIND